MPESSEKPHMTVLGEPVEKPRRHVDRRDRIGRHGDVVFGMMLLFAGLVLFAQTLGVVSWEFWRVVAHFWPLALILIGLQIVLGRGALGWLLMFLVSLVSLGFVAAYGLFMTGSPVIMWFPEGVLRAIEWFNGLTNAYYV